MSGDLRAPTGIKWNPGGTSGVAEFGSDSNLLVMFYNRSVQDLVKSNNEGRPVHINVIHVKIQQPGEMLNIIDRPATDDDKKRFSRQWTAFVHDRTQVPEGTPIDLLFPNHPNVADNLRSMGVFTIEQCAALSANAIDSIGRGGQEYVNRAKRYLDSANKGVAFHKLQREKEELEQKVRMLEQQHAQMRSQLDSMVSKINDPIRNSMQPQFMPGYDVQTERINANSPQQEIAKRSKKKVERRAPTVEDSITDPFAGTAGVSMLDEEETVN